MMERLERLRAQNRRKPRIPKSVMRLGLPEHVVPPDRPTAPTARPDSSDRGANFHGKNY
jgi:hypothetical protein